MKELAWYFPVKLQEIPGLLKRGCIVHGGGTNLLRSGLLRSSRSRKESQQVKGIIDISKIEDLKSFRYDNSRIFLGSGLTYRETKENISGLNREHILVKALKNAASNALRNRITLGGSIASFPPWSDLAGPLISLDAEVYFITADSLEEKAVHADEFLKTPSGRKNVFITGIGFKNIPYSSWYYRDVRTRFDYPKFTITILVSGKGTYFSGTETELRGTKAAAGSSKSPMVRIVITGVKGRFVREYALEDDVGKLIFNGSFAEDELKVLINKKLTARFQKKAETSGEYLRHVASVELGRGLKELRRSLM